MDAKKEITMSIYNPVNWFEIPVEDLDRAKGFYESVFNLELSVNQMGPLQMAWFPMQEGATGATGTLVKGDGYQPSNSGTLVYLAVNNIEETLGKIESCGGKVLMPKMNIGEYGFYAHFEDCEGNRVALHAMS